MSNETSINTSLIEEWVANKINIEEVNKKLISLGLTETNINEHVNEFKRLRYAKRRFNAFIFLAVGAFIGFLSCVLTVTDVLPHMFDVFLYGLTTTAAILVFRGLYLLFEG
jgi:hypothetical protein